MSITNGGQRTASELVRLEISELKDYANELETAMAQEVYTREMLGWFLFESLERFRALRTAGALWSLRIDSLDWLVVDFDWMG